MKAKAHIKRFRLVVVLAASLSAQVDAKELIHAKVDLLSRPIAAHTPVRVKIFPHKRDYKPHGQDTRTSKASLVSEKACKIYKASPEAPRSSGVALYSARDIHLDAAKLDQALWIDCEAPTSLLRQPELPSFRYTGDFYVRRVKKDTQLQLEVINIVGMRDYLKGVVPSEVYAHWPMEALKTQAVAARTYATYHFIFSKRYARSRFWDVDDTIQFQAYTGLSLRTPRTDEAVTTTEGQILLYSGKVIQAYYHADSAGRTESAWNVWNSDIPYVAPIEEFFTEQQEPSTWTRRLSLRTLERKLKKQGLINGNSKLINVNIPVIGRTASGRVRLVTLLFDDGSFKNVGLAQLKSALSKNLPSTLFDFQKDLARLDLVWIKGQGKGHGVGLSQRGALFLANNQSWTYDQILDFYYHDTSLCEMSERSRTNLPSCHDLAQEQKSVERLAAEASAS